MESAGENSPGEERLKELSKAAGTSVLLVNSSIDDDCFLEVQKELNKLGSQQTLSLVLNSPGGSIEYAFWIAKAVAEQCQQLDVLVFDRAKSAATLIALEADRILLGQFGELGPLDPQSRDPAGGVHLRSPLEIVKGLEFLRTHYFETFDMMVYDLTRRRGMDLTHALDHAARLLAPIAQSLYQSIDYRELGEAVRLLGIGEEYARETMRRWVPLADDSTDRIVRQLVWEYPDHGHIIDVAEAHRIGLSNVGHMDSDLEELLFDVIDREETLITAIPVAGNGHNDGGKDASSASGGISVNETNSVCEQ